MNPITIKGCIFDLDGVICSTAEYHYLAWRELARSLGITFTEQDNEKLKGVSRMDSLEIILGTHTDRYTAAEKSHMAAHKNTIYLEYINKMNQSRLSPGISDFLRELKKQKIKTALGSVSKNAPLILQKLQITDLFDSIVDGNKVSRAKPDPEVFLTAAGELHLEPAGCIVFEDAIAGVQAAHNAGMACIGVGDPLILTEADHVIPDFKDCPAWFPDWLSLY